MEELLKVNNLVIGNKIQLTPVEPSPDDKFLFRGAGDVWYDATENVLKVYNGTSELIAATTTDVAAVYVSPALTSIPTAPTAVLGTSTTQLATTAFVTTQLAAPIQTTPIATSGGLTTGILTATNQFASVTSASADNICCLPAASAALVGTVIRGKVGDNGFELRVAAADAATVCINDVTTDVEAAIPADTSFTVVLVDETHWILTCVTKLGAVVTAIVPDAIA